MKNLILFLILIGVGAWYCYDKYGDEIPFLAGKAKQVDPRIAEIKTLAEKYFPTKLDERERWIKSQISAMNALDRKIGNVPDDVYSALLKKATQQYPDNYSNRLSFVTKQTSAYEDIENKFGESSFSSEEKNMMRAELFKTFEHNYSAQVDILAQALEVYAMVKTKSMQMSTEDFKKISSKTIHKLISSPNECLLFFENQIRARHNFLTKQLPPSHANLRTEIEKKIPDDFVAQLNALDVAIDNIVYTKSNTDFEEYKNISKTAQEIFKKYTYLIDASDSTFNVYFATMHGKKVAIFPSELLQNAKSTLTLDLGADEKISFDNVFMSSDSTLAIMVVEGNYKIDTIKFASKSIEKSSKDIEIIGVRTNGKKFAVSGKLENGKYIIFKEADKSIVRSLTSGSLILEKETGTPLGFFEVSPNYDSRTYASYEDPNIDSLLNNPNRVSLWKGMDKTLILAKKNTGVADNYTIVYLEDLKKFAKYDSKKYAKQKTLLDDICRVNMSALTFILQGAYGADALDPILKNITDKYDPIFIKGSRCTMGVLRSHFFRYLQSVRTELRANANLARETVSELYYDFQEPATRQLDLYKQIDGVFGGTVARGDVESIIHEDILASVKKGTFVPPGRMFDKPSSGVIQGGLMIRNKGVKKDYNRM